MTRILYTCHFGHLSFYHYHSDSPYRMNEHSILVQSEVTTEGILYFPRVVQVLAPGFPLSLARFLPCKIFLLVCVIWTFYLVFIFSFPSSGCLWFAVIVWSTIAMAFWPVLSNGKHLLLIFITSIVLVWKEAAWRYEWWSINYQTILTALSWPGLRCTGWWEKI